MSRCASIVALLAIGCAAPTSAPVVESVPEQAVTLAPAVPFGPPPPPPLDRPIRVLVGGDLLPHRPSLATPASIRAALAPLGPLFEKADGVVGNYEAATGDVDGKSPGARLVYAAPPGWLEELPRAGIKNLTVANNHACDLGYEGVDATLAAAAAADVVAIGGDAKDPWAARVIAERSGKRVCAVAWTTVMNAPGACAKSARLAIATLDRHGKAKIDHALARARSFCDATIAIFHGGEEYVKQTSMVMDLARHAAESGADAVVIHHPHVPAPVVLHVTKDARKVPLFASVGNLASNQGESWKPPMFPVLRENRRLVCVNGWTRLGVIADLAFMFDKEEARLDWGYHLTWTENEHVDNKNVAVPKIETRLFDAEKDAAVLARLSDDAAGPVDLFDDNCWIERPLYVPGDVVTDERCSATLRHLPAEKAPAPLARRGKDRRSR
jgi:poly-gamma-glutamate synthesis protein (capsule biosynthesis protein)